MIENDASHLNFNHDKHLFEHIEIANDIEELITVRESNSEYRVFDNPKQEIIKNIEKTISKTESNVIYFIFTRILYITLTIISILLITLILFYLFSKTRLRSHIKFKRKKHIVKRSSNEIKSIILEANKAIQPTRTLAQEPEENL